MKRILVTIFCLSLFFGSFAQELANFMGSAPIVSPEITNSGITFRISAPYADNVKLNGSWGASVEMTRSANGVWSVTIPTPTPELYTYSFNVDGISYNDPANVLMQRDGTRYLSVLLVPGEATANYFEATQRGNLSQVWYDSPTLGINRRLFVYTPYGYNKGTTKYPVLYLLHGAGGDEDAWSTMGRTCQIMDNLIEKGLAKPMLVVMPNGNPTQQAARTTMLPEVPIDRNAPNYDPNGYVNSIVKDIVPYIESNYRVIANPNSRALAGLSMGAGHTISCTNLYPGFFSYICPLSNGIRVTDENKATYEEQFKALKKAGYKLYWIGCGEDDFLIESARTLDATLTSLGLKHTFYVNSGGHTWTNWRIYLNKFAPLLFK
ncbi:MAG: alpha/beta hydrolase-fold protein [Bacteroidales bacterium]|jgi:enterochelin esterase-like enzyme|nr:esterase [Bacteroidota bacterium]